MEGMKEETKEMAEGDEEEWEGKGKGKGEGTCRRRFNGVLFSLLFH
jgi:hypothetical protein